MIQAVEGAPITHNAKYENLQIPQKRKINQLLLLIKKRLEWECVQHGMTYFFVFFVKIRRKRLVGKYE